MAAAAVAAAAALLLLILAQVFLTAWLPGLEGTLICILHGRHVPAD